MNFDGKYDVFLLQPAYEPNNQQLAVHLIFFHFYSCVCVHVCFLTTWLMSYPQGKNKMPVLYFSQWDRMNENSTTHRM